MRRKVVLILAVLMLATSISGLAQGNDHIGWMQDQGWIVGREDGNLDLDATITRAEMTKMIIVMNDLEDLAKEYENTQSKFSDINRHWASGYVNLAASLGMVNGYPEGDYKPDAKITYAESIAMTVRIHPSWTEKDEESAKWPDSYTEFAKVNNMLSLVNTKVDINSPAPRKDVFGIVYSTSQDIQSNKAASNSRLENRLERLEKQYQELKTQSKETSKDSSTTKVIYNNSDLERQIRALERKIKEIEKQLSAGGTGNNNFISKKEKELQDLRHIIWEHYELMYDRENRHLLKEFLDNLDNVKSVNEMTDAEIDKFIKLGNEALSKQRINKHFWDVNIARMEKDKEDINYKKYTKESRERYEKAIEEIKNIVSKPITNQIETHKKIMNLQNNAVLKPDFTDLIEKIEKAKQINNPSAELRLEILYAEEVMELNYVQYSTVMYHIHQLDRLMSGKNRGETPNNAQRYYDKLGELRSHYEKNYDKTNRHLLKNVIDKYDTRDVYTLSKEVYDQFFIDADNAIAKQIVNDNGLKILKLEADREYINYQEGKKYYTLTSQREFEDLYATIKNMDVGNLDQLELDSKVHELDRSLFNVLVLDYSGLEDLITKAKEIDNLSSDNKKDIIAAELFIRRNESSFRSMESYIRRLERIIENHKLGFNN